MEDLIILKTAICCMACDGTINEEEVKILHDSLKNDFDLDIIQSEIVSFNSMGKQYLKEYINSLCEYKNKHDLHIKILNTAVKMIKADQEVEYAEIKFFKLIFNTLGIEPQFVLENISDIDEDWVEEDFGETNEEAYNKFFSSVTVPSMNIDIKTEFVNNNQDSL